MPERDQRGCLQGTKVQVSEVIASMRGTREAVAGLRGTRIQVSEAVAYLRGTRVQVNVVTEACYVR